MVQTTRTATFDKKNTFRKLLHTETTDEKNDQFKVK